MQKEIMVSITCTTYNHENYIADAIDSFLMQKTNFRYEILIHDDASTDRTPEIIKDYEMRYPDLIKPMYQTENQYSKGVKVSKFNWERAKGKYIAICEGDDYWNDPYKLQKQVNYMEEHPECTLCVHAAYKVDSDKKRLKSHVRPNKGNKIFTIEEVILGGGGLFATNSMLYPAALNNNLPDFYNNAPVGDFPLAIYLSLNGKVYYIDEFMSSYRVGVLGSWSNRMASIERQVNFINEIEHMLNEVNCYSEFKYEKAIVRKIKINKMNLMLKQERFNELKTGEYQELYDGLNKSKKFMIFIKQYFPSIAQVLIKAKRNLI